MNTISILIFFLLNSFMVLSGSIYYVLANINTFMIFAMTILKNIFLLNVLEKAIEKKDDIGIRQQPIEKYKGEFMYNVVQASTIEAVGVYIAKKYILTDITNINMLIYFIPISFIFELIFDFFHYWTHYFAHKNAYLYKYWIF